MLSLKYKSYPNGHECLSYLYYHLLFSINIYQCPLYNTDGIASVPRVHCDTLTRSFSHTYIALCTAFRRL